MILTRNNQEIHCWPVRAREIETVFEHDDYLAGAASDGIGVTQAVGHMKWFSCVWVGP